MSALLSWLRNVPALLWPALGLCLMLAALLHLPMALALAVALLLMSAAAARQRSRRPSPAWRRSSPARLWLTWSSLLALSACGTAPLPAATCPPVPAHLLTPPTPPVLLEPASRSPPPGATTLRMQPRAPPTAHGTST